ncbi:MAG: NADH-quinone oxidoreductase subunit J [Sinobacteraceae bacterium]|nr:NADH-quinone oxidoreductase subunit J [Nevskiaceae bacterium]MCP5360797.1 NADH-quinone oxidoreductase subunit J [Nevskiaceae bacterium]MCP5467035.1 NADH-quinone oxidoreductase subunit J [Nevskiaceae bacterium]MCP5472310.1 NADH-quinone oxidoreductase subunit J [Nevskiaceae bacterium]
MIQALFYGFSLVLVLAALGVIMTRNPVHSALCLVLAFFSSAAIWLLIEAEFLAIVLILVYVGAVMVLFLFVVMMLDVTVEEVRRGFTRHAWVGWLVALLVIAQIVSVIWFRGLGIDATVGAVPLPPDYSNTRELGAVLYTQYVYPFELAAVLLLLAIVAAITLTMRRRAGLKVQDVSAQVAVRAADRVHLVKVAATRREQPVPEGDPADAAGTSPIGPEQSK